MTELPEYRETRRFEWRGEARDVRISASFTNWTLEELVPAQRQGSCM